MEQKQTREKIEAKILALSESIDTLTFKIKELGTFYSYLQVRAWRKNKASLNTKLRYYKAILKQLPSDELSKKQIIKQ